MRYLALMFAISQMCDGADGVREVTLGSLALGEKVAASFENGYLVVVRPLRTVSLWGPDGRRIYETEVSPPSSGEPNTHRFWDGISSATADNDGTVAVAVDFSIWQNRAPGGHSAPWDGKITGHFGGIALLDSAGTQTGFLETGRYLPQGMCFAKDHSIWTIGWEWHQSDDPASDYFVFRRYSRDGKQLGAYVRRSTFPNPSTFRVGDHTGMIRAANERIGAFVCFGPTSKDKEWFEFDLHGDLIGRWSVEEEYLIGGVARWGVALTASGQAYARSPQRTSNFDLGTASWKTVNLGSNLDRLLSADGEELVFLLSEQGRNRLRWVPAPRP